MKLVLVTSGLCATVGLILAVFGPHPSFQNALIGIVGGAIVGVFLTPIMMGKAPEDAKYEMRKPVFRKEVCEAYFVRMEDGSLIRTLPVSTALHS